MNDPFIAALRSRQQNNIASNSGRASYRQDNFIITIWWKLARQWHTVRTEQCMKLEKQAHEEWAVYQLLSHNS